MRVLLLLLLCGSVSAWTYSSEDGTFYSYTNGPEATLTIRRNTEDYAEMYIESDELCLPAQTLANIRVSIDLVNKDERYYGLVSQDGRALFIRFDQSLIRNIESGDTIEFLYDDCGYEFSIVGDPDKLWFLTMYN